jgi:hypothetical protein
MSRRTVLACAIALLGALLFSSIAYAISINVDGVREAAWNGSGGQTPGIYTDTNEILIINGYDIQTVQWTNDGTYMYFLLQTYADTIIPGDPVPTIYICLDTDNNAGTGGDYANCSNMTGIERTIVIFGSMVEVVDGDPNTGPVIGNGTRGTAMDITEVSVSLSSLGFSGTFCPASITSAIYFDNGITNPDDSVPDDGTLTLSCGTPTAVTLDSLQAQPASPAVPVALIGVSAIGLLSSVLFFRRHKQTI